MKEFMNTQSINLESPFASNAREEADADDRSMEACCRMGECL